MTVIDKFDDSFRFLSNFYESPVEYGGYEYPTAEHAYQTQKTLDRTERTDIRNAPFPAMAKQLGRRCTLRPDWEEVKMTLMWEIVRAKFLQNPDLKKQLVDTGDAQLIEGNNWGDTFWGICNGVGKNQLGIILMTIRAELKARRIKIKAPKNPVSLEEYALGELLCFLNDNEIKMEPDDYSTMEALTALLGSKNKTLAMHATQCLVGCCKNGRRLVVDALNCRDLKHKKYIEGILELLRH
jgi:ribA/ribD-fused uncharacterized protein